MRETETYGREYQEEFGALDYEPFRLMRTFARHLIPPMKILVVGAANPKQVSALVKRGDEVIAIDISAYACQVSKKMCSSLKSYDVVLGDVRRLPFRDGSFDLSVCRYLLEHYDLRTDVEILRELCRVSAGHLIVGVSTLDVRPNRLKADPTHQTFMTFKMWTKFFKSLKFLEVLSESREKEAWILKPVQNAAGGLEGWV
jgi:ubiquinone/menaquinone biosynthesis C-methylase UbiE